MRYGYVRTATQKEEIINFQIERLQEYNVDKIIVETSGHDLYDLLEQLQEGDSIHVLRIEIISRSVTECKKVVKIINDKKCKLYQQYTQIIA